MFWYSFPFLVCWYGKSHWLIFKYLTILYSFNHDVLSFFHRPALLVPSTLVQKQEIQKSGGAFTPWVTKSRQSRRKEKTVIFVTLASPTMVLENVVPDFTAVGPFRKANDLPEMLEDKCGSSDQQVLRCCDISSSCAGLLSSSPTITPAFQYRPRDLSNISTLGVPLSSHRERGKEGWGQFNQKQQRRQRYCGSELGKTRKAWLSGSGPSFKRPGRVS